MADANLYRFSSKEYHTPSGLIYYLYRNYDPNLQRWLNRDPSGDLMRTRHYSQKLAKFELKSHRQVPVFERLVGANLHYFVGNNSITQTDPLGLDFWQSPYYWGYNNPPYVPSACLTEIGNAVQMFLGNSGVSGFPTANDDDSLQHCITSCRIAKACGSAVSGVLGYLKEVNDMVHGGSGDETAKDLQDDAHGIAGAKCKKSCEDYCNDTRGDYP